MIDLEQLDQPTNQKQKIVQNAFLQPPKLIRQAYMYLTYQQEQNNAYIESPPP